MERPMIFGGKKIKTTRIPINDTLFYFTNGYLPLQITLNNNKNHHLIIRCQKMNF